MSSNKEKKRSFISILRSEGRINDEFLSTISDLKLEEIIAVKLEMSAKSLKGKLYNFPLWHALPYISREACLLFAKTTCKTKSDMASLLGIPYTSFMEIYDKYKLEIDD